MRNAYSTSLIITSLESPICYFIGKRPIQYKKTRPSLQLVYCWKDNYDKICASLFHSYIAKVSVCLGCQSSLASLAKLFSDQISHILTEEAPLVQSLWKRELLSRKLRLRSNWMVPGTCPQHKKFKFEDWQIPSSEISKKLHDF